MTRSTIRRAVLALGCLLAAGTGFSREPGPDPDGTDAFQSRVLPLLEKYCINCHMEGDAKADLALDLYDDQAAALKDGKTWLRVLDALDGGTMPPPNKPRPTLAEIETVTGWIEHDYLAAQCGEGRPPAPVVIRRLNRQEYDNTIRDLLGVDLKLAATLFPADDVGFGFDNVGSALNVSPILVEKYLDAAEAALAAAIRPPDVAAFAPRELIGLQTHRLPPDKPVEFEHTLRPGRYLVDFSLVRVGVAESVAPPRLIVGLGKDRRTVEAVAVQDETVVYRYWLTVVDGDASAFVALAPGEEKGENVVAPSQVGAAAGGDQRYGSDRGLHVDSMVVRGPLVVDPASLPESHRRLLPETPGLGDAARLDAARATVSRFVDLAFRRPASAEDVDRVLTVFRLADDRGESFERAAQVALTSVLASPRFLYLVEPDAGTPSVDRPLDEFELASRLSYFLWSSMPDEPLFAQARAGTLRANLREQVGRMLDDPKSSAFTSNFAGQWLQLRRLEGVAPDPDRFPGFDEALRASMREETERFFAYVLHEDRSILELLDADYTFVNPSLAKHYGIDGVDGEGFRRVSLTDGRRGGVLTQASVLTLTSNPNRTSPVKRGQFILQQLLGTPPPPPPPDIPKLDDDGHAGDPDASLRERMERHRADPQCASCHQQMDALGFALENYDAVGRWRVNDGEAPIDASGELSGGRSFRDVRELKNVLRGTATRKFAQCLIKNMLTYALGRGLEPADFCTVEDVRSRLAGDGWRVRNVVLGIVESRAFQNRGVAP
ncbi:DUF1592 domain-containing protein [Planctomyces sp. SH-PL62]|uniref:DUF1592 domain-containing protein n=1 Tax=Planctomyces sp. SH-PL62 TaxID=1636152 RepID=UPI00078C57B7|nr:DUF1592 domain-containing protein [Planctomyces sp. SH-PL62]AMV40704.1 hypothetical protein VT85_24950 [Planctomyces sp. SH-PL62]